MTNSLVEDNQVAIVDVDEGDLVDISGHVGDHQVAVVDVNEGVL